MKILFLCLLLSLTPAYGNSSEESKAALTEEEIEKKGFDTSSQSIVNEIKSQDEKVESKEDTKKDEEQPIRTSLPKYTIMQIREMKAKGIEPDTFEEKPLLNEEKQDQKEAEENEKVIYHDPQSACAHLSLAQVCEYRKAGYGRWIGNCVKKANSTSLYCK